MYLSEGKIGGSYHVKDIKLPTKMEKRLEALGMTRGTSVVDFLGRMVWARPGAPWLAVLNSKSQGVLIIKVRGTRFALGRNITKKILVG